MLRRHATAALAAAVVAEEIAHGQQKLRHQVVRIISPEVLVGRAGVARVARVAATAAVEASGGLGIATAVNDSGSRAHDSEDMVLTYGVLALLRHEHEVHKASFPQQQDRCPAISKGSLVAGPSQIL